MACMYLRNEIKTFNIKRNINYKEQYLYEKQKSFYKYKGSVSVSCEKPHMSN